MNKDGENMKAKKFESIIMHYADNGNLDTFEDCDEKEYFLDMIKRMLSEEKVMTDDEANKIELEMESALSDLDRTKIILNVIDTYRKIPEKVKLVFRKYRPLLEDIRKDPHPFGNNSLPKKISILKEYFEVK